MSELKPAGCPHCGAALTGVGDADGNFYEHPKNDCWLSEWEFHDLNVAAWNRRATQPASAPADDDYDGPDLTAIDIPPGDRLGNPYDQLCAAWHREPCGDTKAAIGSAILALRPIYDAPLDDCLLVLQKANEFLTVPAEEAVWAGDIEGIERFAQFWKARGAAVGAPQGQAEPDLAKLIYQHTGLTAQQGPGEYAEILALCKDVLAQGQAEPVAWISVKDRMPQIEQAVLVTDGKNVTTATWNRWGWGTHEISGHDAEVAFEHAITHWTPLLAAPTQPTQPHFDQAEFDKLVKAGTKAWAGTPDNWVDEQRGYGDDASQPTQPVEQEDGK